MKKLIAAAFVAATLFFAPAPAQANPHHGTPPPGYGGHHQQGHAVYAYDVYYWGFNQYSRRHEWHRYASYWSQGDAQRAAAHVRHAYRATTQIVSRFWRMSYNSR